MDPVTPLDPVVSSDPVVPLNLVVLLDRVVPLDPGVPSGPVVPFDPIGSRGSTGTSSFILSDPIATSVPAVFSGFRESNPIEPRSNVRPSFQLDLVE